MPALARKPKFDLCSAYTIFYPPLKAKFARSYRQCFQVVVLEKSLESPLDSKEIKSINPKGNQPWIFTGRTDAETEDPIVWAPDANSQLWKRPWCWERLRAEGEGGNRGWDIWMASSTQRTWVWANPGESEVQGSLACCSPWGHRVRRNLAQLNNKISAIYMSELPNLYFYLAPLRSTFPNSKFIFPDISNINCPKFPNIFYSPPCLLFSRPPQKSVIPSIRWLKPETTLSLLSNIQATSNTLSCFFSFLRIYSQHCYPSYHTHLHYWNLSLLFASLSCCLLPNPDAFSIHEKGSSWRKTLIMLVYWSSTLHPHHTHTHTHTHIHTL